MTDSKELNRTLAQLTARNVQISQLIEALRGRRPTDESRAREAALQQEFEANEAIIKRMTGEASLGG